MSVLPEGPTVQVASGSPSGSESKFTRREVGIITALPLAGVCRVNAAVGSGARTVRLLVAHTQ